ncbi:acyl-CoA dehydrogenase [Pseudomonas sp. GM21]|uniref:acyl-CoA dehydrogenase family protein n=1 Tax=Pseudomonas sp. GM21 TaxID=1144325 RepID=UPI0002725312|nr:acyl-CoA dehydrogenase family protein [Pseudomonas sp. GM21]EJM24323.1 acyl-CoA dehydrogenase [Pseudomonas sp. GM21]
MDFSLSATQQQLADLATRLFADQASQPRLRTLDANGYHDTELWAKLAEMGLLGVHLTEEQGGVGEGFETLCVFLEHAARAVAPVPLLEVLVGGALPLQALADAPVLEGLLPKLAAGEVVCTSALAEARQIDVLDVSTRAEWVNGQWRLSGCKQRVPVADQPGVCWTLARYADGVGVFLFDLQATGIERQQQTATSGEYVFTLTLQEVSANLLVDASATPAFVDNAQLHLLAATTAMAVGVCSTMTRIGAEYTSEREQFGRPIATFQAVAHALADCHIDSECLRGLMEQAVSRLSQPGDTASATEAVLAASIYACEALHRVSQAVQQVHGGTGVDRDYPLFRYCLLAKKLEMVLGGQSALIARLGVILAND